MSSRIELEASLHQLPKAMEWVRAHLQKSGFSKGEIVRLELALEEAFVNSIVHGYKGREGTLVLEFKLIGRQQIEILLIDFGPPFNPLEQAPEVDLEKPIEEREVGGMGIYLMRLCVDEVEYQRKGDANQLRFVKKCSP